MEVLLPEDPPVGPTLASKQEKHLSILTSPILSPEYHCSPHEEPQTFAPTTTNLETSSPTVIATLRTAILNLEILTPTSPSFTVNSHTYIATRPPLAILRPRISSDVSAIIRTLTSTTPRTPFTVRSGGHDLFARHTAPNTIQIDLRHLDHVTIASDRKTARIGGGALMADRAEKLSREGLMSPNGAIPDVGMGWSLVGGYSLMSSLWGMGVDQVVGVRIVDARGEEKEWDESTEEGREMMWAMKGAGMGNWGVVTEVRVRCYEMPVIIAGRILYTTPSTSTLSTTCSTFFTAYNALEPSMPPHLMLEPFAVNIPHGPHKGQRFGCFFVFLSSDVITASLWLDRAKNLCGAGNCAFSSVAATTPGAFASQASGMVGSMLRGPTRTATVREVVGEVVEVTSSWVERLPKEKGCLWYAHRLRRDSPSVADEGLKSKSCFGVREQHWMFEIIGNVAVNDGDENIEDREREAEKWTTGFEAALKGTGKCEKWTYHAMTHPGQNHVRNSYGDGWERLLELKRKYDPENVFNNAQPCLAEAFGTEPGGSAHTKD